MLGQGGALLFAGTIGRAKQAEANGADRQDLQWKPPVITLAALFAYAALMPVLGFALSSFLFIAGMLMAFKPRRWIGSVVIAGTTVLLSYLLFVTLLKVRMPAGLLGLG